MYIIILCTATCACSNRYMNKDIYTYIYMYIQSYIHTHIYIYTHTHARVLPSIFTTVGSWGHGKDGRKIASYCSMVLSGAGLTACQVYNFATTCAGSQKALQRQWESENDRKTQLFTHWHMVVFYMCAQTVRQVCIYTYE